MSEVEAPLVPCAPVALVVVIAVFVCGAAAIAVAPGGEPALHHPGGERVERAAVLGQFLGHGAAQLGHGDLGHRIEVRTGDEIEAQAIRMKSQKKDLRLVVVDYIGQLRPDRKFNSRTDEVAEISRRLLQLATRENLTVISCAQLNRLSAVMDSPR